MTAENWLHLDEVERRVCDIASEQLGIKRDRISPSDRIIEDLTAIRTVALRNALANDPVMAFIAALHVFVLKTFYRYGSDSCLEITAQHTAFNQTQGLGDTVWAKEIEQRQESWGYDLPGNADEWITALTPDLAVFVKYDLWPGYLNALVKRKIPFPCADPIGFIIHTPPTFLNSSTNMEYSRGRTNVVGMKS